MSQPEIRKGDKVRLAVEGIVKEIWGHDPIYQLDNGVNYAVSQYVVEILERARPKVGDVLDHSSEVTDLPAGSVVVNRNGYPIIVGDGEFRYSFSPPETFERVKSRPSHWGPYTIKYVPE